MVSLYLAADLQQMAVCLKFAHQARRKHVLHVSDVMGQSKSVSIEQHTCK